MNEYKAAGATITDDLSTADAIVGIVDMHTLHIPFLKPYCV